MRLGFRGKLFASSLALVVLVAAVSGVFLESALRKWFAEDRETQLIALVKAARAVATRHLEQGHVSELQSRVHSLGADIGGRVTVIAQSGSVIADSALSEREVSRMNDHSRRPEVLGALRSGLGVARRRSTTLGSEMLYVAVPFEQPPHRGVVRLAMPGREVDAAVRRLRLLIVLGISLGTAAAAGMGVFASRMAARSLEELVVKAARAAGEGGRRIEVHSTDELAGLAGSFNEMAAQLERVVAELATERDRMEAVLGGLADGVLAVDRSMVITEANPAAMRLLNLETSPRGQPLLDVVRLPMLGELADQALSVAEARGEVRLEGPPARILEITATPQGVQGDGVLLLRDVTDLRRLEAVRRDFVANVSHELRTPISTLCVNAETLLSGVLEQPGQARVFVEGMHRNARRLADVVNDLLDLSRLEAGRYELHVKPIQAAEVVVAVLDVCEARARLSNLAFDTELEEELCVQADAKALEHVLTNLVDNAIKYTPAGERVGLRAARHADRVCFEVWDTGPGIAESHRARLFERFYRVDAGRSRDKGGTGLGLSIVRHLSEAMGGQVGMRPNPGGGSIFWVDLPAGSEVDGDGDDSSGQLGQHGDGTREEFGGFAVGRILYRAE